MASNRSKKQVVYLIGAGASHGSVKYVNYSGGILMVDLKSRLDNKIRNLIEEKDIYSNLKNLVNTIVSNDTDYEHVITFLDESTSNVHRQFAEELRIIFEKVLKAELISIEEDLKEERFKLYSALLDMHQLEDIPEELHGILSLNYDKLLEEAAEAVHKQPVDFGIGLIENSSVPKSIRLIKLHGSFYWEDNWPISEGDRGSPLWIPPGIQKSKERYPFNILWGLAREMLNCDVLRIIGCKLSQSDWDLISLLFTTRHGNITRNQPYRVEVIDHPQHAIKLQQQFPYLDIHSILEIDEIGEQLISERIGGLPRSFHELDENEKNKVLSNWKDDNWFQIWLKQRAEMYSRDLNISSIQTDFGEFARFLTGN